MAQQNDLVLYRGEHFVPQFVMDPAPTDITGWNIVLSVRASFTAPSVLLQKSATIVNASQGVFEVALTRTNTNIAAGAYVYDVWRVDTGYEQVLSIGKFVVKPEVRDLTGLTTDSPDHVDGDVWVTATGTSPSRRVSIMTMDNGSEVEVAFSIV